MILYHGSNVEVYHPRLISEKRTLDFGVGFYLTSDYNQAAEWAKIKTRRKQSGNPYVSIFEFDIESASSLKFLTFESPNGEWLKYIASHRLSLIQLDLWDIVAGPVADDKTIKTISMYFSGIYTAEETIKRLIPQKLKDQYCFKTDNALKTIQLIEVKKI